MKRILFVFSFFTVLVSCNSNTTTGNSTNAAANDSSQHANGITNGDVISIDTSATKVKPAAGSNGSLK